MREGFFFVLLFLREEKRYKKELRRRQRHVAATGNVSFDNGGISRRNSELVPSASRSPIYQVETENHQRKSVIVPSPSASSVSSGRSKYRFRQYMYKSGN